MDNDIVFEDLHGLDEEKPIEVDLDAETKDDGISLAPADEVAVGDVVADDTDVITGLRDADASQIADDDAGASSVSEDDGYSKKVKARIARESKAKRLAQKESDYWKGQAHGLAKAQSTQSKEGFEKDIEQATSGIAATLVDLEAAIEGGNTKDQVRLTEQLTNQKAEKIQAEVLLSNLSESGNLQPFDGKVDRTSKSQPLNEKWMEDRGDWYGARGFTQQTRLANRLDREVFDEGYDPKTPEYYDELDRRIKEKQPDLYDVAADDDSPTTRRRPTRSPVAPVGGADSGRQRSKSKVQLGAEDFANMRRFGLNPNDPEVLKEYARNKQRDESQGAVS